MFCMNKVSGYWSELALSSEQQLEPLWLDFFLSQQCHLVARAQTTTSQLKTTCQSAQFGVTTCSFDD